MESASKVNLIPLPKTEQKTLDVNYDVSNELEILNQLLRIMRGQEDPRTHVTVITNPDIKQLLSSSNLTEKQLEAIINMKWIYSIRPEFKALNDYADTALKGAISKGGWGTLQGIHLAEAYAPRLVGNNSIQQPEPKKHWYKREKKEEGDKK